MFTSLKLVLSALECFEVFLELSADSATLKTKWLLISIIEVVKFAIGMFLLFEPHVNPRSQSNQPKPVSKEVIGKKEVTFDDDLVTMTRSKRKIRTIASGSVSVFVDRILLA